MEIKWPPAYTLKRHHAAKGVKLRVKESKGLEITIPKRFRLKDVAPLIEQHKEWISKHLAPLHQAQTLALPDAIALPFIQQIWRIDYHLAAQSEVNIKSPSPNVLSITGPLENKKLIQLALIRWLKKLAKQHLPPALLLLSQEYNLPCGKVTIRDQQTRWGSCSTENNINLNYKLILMPEKLAKHVMLHELSHTVHANHGPDFWKLLARLDAYCAQHKKALRGANELLPAWLKW